MPLFAPGYFYAAHDGRHSVFYLIQFDASIQDGALWPRWAMHHTQGYGYPTFIIQAPLGFYLAEIFILLGAGYTTAAKLSWAVGTFVGGWGMYQLIVTWLRCDALRCDASSPAAENQERTPHHLMIPFAGLVAALIYVFIPYHFLGMYVRAALNDTLLLAWFPWVILAFDQLIGHGLFHGSSVSSSSVSSSSAQGRVWWLAIAALCLGGVLLTHTFALISFTPLLISFILFRLGVTYWQSRNWRVTLGAALLALGAGIGAILLYANFLLPLLLEGSPHLQEQVYVADTYDFRRHFVYWGQFFNPHWGFGFSDDPDGAMDGMGFQVGALALLVAIVSLYLHRQKLEDWLSANGASDSQSVEPNKPAPLLTAYSLYLLTISWFVLTLMTPWATPLWESIPLLAVIQFPWRLLSLVACTISALAGLTVWQLVQWTSRDSSSTAHEALAGLAMLGLLAIFGSHRYIDANLSPIEPWREDGRAIVFFEREHPDMMGYTEWVDGKITESPMTSNYLDEQYVEDYTENGILERLVIAAGSGEILSRYSRGSSMGGVVRADGEATVRILVYHFPGWQVTIDDRPVAHTISKPEGLLEVQVPAGEHRIDARMGATPIRRAGTAISGGTFLLLLAMLVFGRNRREPLPSPP